MAKFKTAKSATKGNGYPVGTALPGGDYALAGTQIKLRVKIGSNAEADGYIVRQKGAKKFLVSDGSNEGVCTLANLADASLTADTMTVTCTMSDGSTTFKASRLTNKFVWDQSNNKYLVGASANAGTTPETVAVESA